MDESDDHRAALPEPWQRQAHQVRPTNRRHHIQFLHDFPTTHTSAPEHPQAMSATTVSNWSLRRSTRTISRVPHHTTTRCHAIRVLAQTTTTSNAPGCSPVFVHYSLTCPLSTPTRPHLTVPISYPHPSLPTPRSHDPAPSDPAPPLHPGAPSAAPRARSSSTRSAPSARRGLSRCPSATSTSRTRAATARTRT